MPQMAPLLWLNLYTMFTLVLLLTIILNYFIKTPSKVNPNMILESTKKANWKW